MTADANEFPGDTEVGDADSRTRPPAYVFGRWLIENTPRGTDLEAPARRDSAREIPFIGEVDR